MLLRKLLRVMIRKICHIGINESPRFIKCSQKNKTVIHNYIKRTKGGKDKNEKEIVKANYKKMYSTLPLVQDLSKACPND